MNICPIYLGLLLFPYFLIIIIGISPLKGISVDPYYVALISIYILSILIMLTL